MGTRTVSDPSVAVEVLLVTPRINRWAEARVAHVATDIKLSLRQLAALGMIEDEKTTLGDVARHLMVTPAVVTGLIDRLERRGYVRRISSTGDRRRVHLTLTDEGRGAARKAQDYLVNEFSASLEQLSEQEKQTIARAMEILRPVISDLESRSGSRSSAA